MGAFFLVTATSWGLVANKVLVRGPVLQERMQGQISKTLALVSIRARQGWLFNMAVEGVT